VSPPSSGLSSDEDDDDQVVLPVEVEPASPRSHTQRNMQIFESAFPDISLHRKLVYVNETNRSTFRRPLFASRLKSHRFLNPAFYHENFAISNISTPDLLAKLRAFQAVNPIPPYESPETLHRLEDVFLYCFKRDKIRSESDVRKTFGKLVRDVIAAVNPAQTSESQCEFVSGAAGFLCVRVAPGAATVDPNAGYLGKTDKVFFFGDVARFGEEVPFCIIEFKFLGPKVNALTLRWFECSGALFPQVLQSTVGHDARVGIAFTEQGFKVLLKETVRNAIRLFMWPPGNSFYLPDPTNITDGLKVLTLVIRVVTRNRNKLAPRFPVKAATVKTAASTPSHSPVKLPGHGSGSKNSSSAKTVRKSIKKRPTSGDKKRTIMTSNSELIPVTTLCLKSRFTDEELEEILRLEDEYESEVSEQ